MLYFFLGAVVLVALIYAARAFTSADPAKLAQWLRMAGGLGALAFAGLLLTRGAFEFAIPVGAFGLWLLTQKGGLLPDPARASRGQSTRAQTDHLEVALDHDTGEMTGRILKGFFANRTLNSLKPAELVHLWQDCRYLDEKSARIVEAYLDREYPNWRDDLARGEAEMASGPGGRMPPAEARKILGLGLGATPDDIRKAHRELMMRMHPDRGGSPYLAAKINEAKDVLLDEGA